MNNPGWLIPLDGIGRPVEFDSTDQLQQMYRLIDCKYVELVRIHPTIDVWLDEEGAINGAPINEVGTQVVTALAGFAEIEWTDLLHGNLLFLSHSGEDAVGLDPDDLQFLQILTVNTHDDMLEFDRQLTAAAAYDDEEES